MSSNLAGATERRVAEEDPGSSEEDGSECDQSVNGPVGRLYAWDGPEDEEIVRLKAEVEEQERQLEEHQLHVLESEAQLETMIKDLRADLQVSHGFVLPWCCGCVMTCKRTLIVDAGQPTSWRAPCTHGVSCLTRSWMKHLRGNLACSLFKLCVECEYERREEPHGTGIP
jgi:hypothetical protein